MTCTLPVGFCRWYCEVVGGLELLESLDCVLLKDCLCCLFWAWVGPRIQREDPQLMPDADELEGARRLAHLAFAEQGELSRYCLSSSASPPRSDLPRLLRCCLLLLPILDAGDPDLAVRCGRRLLAFLRAILSRDPDPSLLPALEVFVENVVVSDRLRRCFTRADGAILKGSRVSTVAPLCWGELHVVLELMSHHFISSVQGEGGFEQFLSALSWSGKAAEGTPEIGLLGAISLVHRGCLFSMPVVVQAHFVLLASRCVGNGDLDPHLLAFENAMNAYLRYLPALGVFYRTSGVISPLSYFAKKRPFNSCIQDTTNQKLSCQISRLLSFCKLHSDDDLHTNERDIFDIAVRFIEENQHLVHEQFRQQVVIDVKRIVSNILGCAKQKEMHELDVIVSEEIICLAAVLRLMGSSFLQILYCIRQMRVADGRKNENYLSLCKVYSFISEAIRLLGLYEANELHRHDLFGMIGKPVDRERASMLMLAHFTSLLVCCLRMRFGFLWKGCIIMMMVAMNLLIVEEEILGLCLGGSKDSAISSIDQEANLKDFARRKSSTVVALQFSNLQKVHIQDEVRHDFGEGSRLGTLRRCKSRDGGGDVRSFFECLPEYKRNSSEWNDIKDFVECKPGMDYSNWWMQHKKFKKYMDKKWIRSKRLSLNKKKKECSLQGGMLNVPNTHPLQ